MKKNLEETPLLNFSNPTIQNLIEKRDWMNVEEVGRVRQIYNFVRDEIQFGYNRDDAIEASEILEDRYGQCNTKSTLLMALLRAVNIPNRLHGFTIKKALQKGAITGIGYLLAPKNILHSWVEVYVQEEWYFLEGVILDVAYLSALQKQNKDCTTFCGFGVFTTEFQNPEIDWNLNHTYIQKEGINQDFGLFNSPDEFYEKHRQEMNPLKKLIFRKIIRKQMNKNVNAIRDIG